MPVARYVTLEGPVREVDFDLSTDIAASAAHYLGDGAPAFIAGIEGALSAGRRWASFELTPETISAKVQQLG